MNLSVHELELLREIFLERLRNKEVFGAPIARTMKTTHSWVYRTLKELTREGLLERKEDDSRKVKYDLTEKGEKVALIWIDLLSELRVNSDSEDWQEAEEWKLI